MSLINEYRATRAAIEELQARLQALEEDGKLQQELEFEKRLRELLAQYNKALPDVLALLDNEGKGRQARQARASKAESAPTRRSRRVKIYTNPNTGEIIETKGGNHKQLKEWKAVWGNDVVESWASVRD